ncbi:MAG: PepSY domain-containing protein [Gemmatimonadetes bacterium]|nr:PepSY domain-containing protein [Gemmatimonadota bacterium]
MRGAVRALKRWTVLAHLYLGVALALLFVMWFATGIVLMYAPFPGFRQQRQFARMSPLHCPACTRPLADALPSMGGRDTTALVRLGMRLDRPVYRFRAVDGGWHALFADDLSAAAALTGDEARRTAAGYARLDEALTGEVELLREPDQWTVEAVLRRELPLWRVDFRDAERTRVYVSAVGGEAITTSTGRERAFAWLGAIPHWIYPRVLRARLGAWLWTIIVLGALGTVMSAAGMAVGLWQFRWRRRDRSASHVPYRTSWMRWHHITGLVFGAVTCTWIFSGTLSVDPFDWSPGDQPSGPERLSLAGGALAGASFALTPAEAVERAGPSVRELRAVALAGRAYWVSVDPSGAARAIAAEPNVSRQAISAEEMMRAAARLLPDAHVVSARTIRAYDDYYYATAERRPPLPAVRVAFDDAQRSVFYLDASSASIVMKQVTRSRLERWLYTGLHDLDFRLLTSHRPLWDVVVILLSLGGLALSLTGVVTGWRWLAWRLGVPAGPRR